MVRTLAYDAAGPCSILGPGGKNLYVGPIRCKNLALYIRDCESMCLSDETPSLKAVGSFYLVSMPWPGEEKDPTQGVNV